jgi:hypothetical protein
MFCLGGHLMYVLRNSIKKLKPTTVGMLFFSVAGMLPFAAHGDTLKALGIHNRKVDADRPEFRRVCSSQYEANIRENMARGGGREGAVGNSENTFRKARDKIYYGKRGEVEEELRQRASLTNPSALDLLHICAIQVALRAVDDTQELALASLAQSEEKLLAKPGNPSGAVSMAPKQDPVPKVVSRPSSARRAPHSAGSTQAIEGTMWNVITTDEGCIAYLTGAFFNNQNTISWSGDCRRGQPISGRGFLTMGFPDQGGSHIYWNGQFVKGYLHGRHKGSGWNGEFVETLNMGCRTVDEPACSSTRPSAPLATRSGQGVGGGTASAIPNSQADDPKVLGRGYTPQ